MLKKSNPWTAKAVPNLKNKIVIITGGNSGLGLESAKVLTAAGAEVVLACRSTNLANEAKQEILLETPKAKLELMQLDLQDLNSVAKFSKAFVQKFKRLDILMNNAGIMNTPYGLSTDGFESQFATNHLGHFALTGQLLALLKRTEASRVITVSSAGHRAGSMRFDNLLFENGKGYTPLRAYCRSKLANLLFAYELQRSFEKNDINCMSVAAHPGASQTNLGRHIEDAPAFKLLNPILGHVVQNSARGALPQLRAATDIQVKGGEYYGPGGLFEMSGFPIRVHSSKASRNIGDAKKLWKESEKLTGISYAF